MAVTVTFESPGLAVVRASGVVLRSESDTAKYQLHEHMVAHGPVRALFLVEDGFLNLEAFASWDDIEVDAYLQQHLIRVALVSTVRWRDSMLLFFISAVAKFQMKHFELDQEEHARTWLFA